MFISIDQIVMYAFGTSTSEDIISSNEACYTENL